MKYSLIAAGIATALSLSITAVAQEEKTITDPESGIEITIIKGGTVDPEERTELPSNVTILKGDEAEAPESDAGGSEGEQAMTDQSSDMAGSGSMSEGDEMSETDPEEAMESSDMEETDPEEAMEETDPAPAQ